MSTRARQRPGRRRPVSHGPRFAHLAAGEVGRRQSEDRQIAKGVCASHSSAGSFSDLAAAGVEATTTVPMRYFRHGSRSWPNTDAVMMLTLVMLALVHTLVSKKPHDEHFSLFGRHFCWRAVSNQLGAGFGFRSRAGIADRRWRLPNPSSGIATVEVQTADRGVHAAVYGAGDLSAVAPDRASVEIICGSTMSRRTEFAAMMQIGRATVIRPKVI